MVVEGVMPAQRLLQVSPRMLGHREGFRVLMFEQPIWILWDHARFLWRQGSSFAFMLGKFSKPASDRILRRLVQHQSLSWSYVLVVVYC